MKLIPIFALAAVVSVFSACNKSVDPDPGKKTDGKVPELSDFRIIYSFNDKDDSVTFDLAYGIQEKAQEYCGVKPKVFPASSSLTEHEIIVGRTSRAASSGYYKGKVDDFVWKIEFKDGNVLIAAGGSWALAYAVERFEEDILKAGFKYEEGRVIEGTVRGKVLFPRYEGTNLRILDDNVWQYDYSSNASYWASQGENCTNLVRSKGFAQLVRAYMPDIVCFQELSNSMNTVLKDSLEAYGFTTTRESKNYTPVFYRSETLELVDRAYAKYGDFTPSAAAKISPGDSKSYTIQVFKHKATGKKFIMVSTHLWWKSNSVLAGSDECRENEVQTLMAAIEDMKKNYDVPVFLTGDMNCKLASGAMKLLTNAGYQPLVKIATDFADGSNGWHPCDSDQFKREYAPGLSTVHSYKEGGVNCIDQFFLFNNNSSFSVKVFRRIHAYFTILLTDHYPNYADIAI